MRAKNLIALVSVFYVVGCGDDPEAPPTNKPTIQIQGTQALCAEKREQTGKVLVLDKVTIAVSDMDGVDDILPPTITMDGVTLDMGTIQKGSPVEPGTEAEGQPKCLAEDFICTGTFTWQRSDGSDGNDTGAEIILCGPGSDSATPPALFDPAPYLDVTLMDRMGWMIQTSILVTK